MTIEATVNKHRGALLIAISGFLVFLYIRHKRQQAAAAAAAQAAAAAAAAAQDPGTMDQNTYSKQFSQPAPAYLGSPYSGYGANAPNFPPPAQSQVGNVTPSPPITFPNPNAASGDSTVGAATGGGAPTSGGTGIGIGQFSNPPFPGYSWPPRKGASPAEVAADYAAAHPAFNPTPAQLANLQAGAAYAQAHSTMQAPIDPSGLPSTTGITYSVPNGMTIGDVTGYVSPQIGTGLYLGAAGEPGTAAYRGVGYVPPA